MTEFSVSQLPVATVLAADDDILVVQGGVTKQAPHSLFKRTGWEQYNDAAVIAANGQNILAGNNASLQIDGVGNIINSQAPSDAVAPLWNVSTNKIAPIASGDAYDVRVIFTAENYTGASPYIDLELDIGGSLNVIAAASIPLLKAGNATRVMIPIPLYTFGTFIANGGLIRLNYEGSGSVDIHSANIVIIRTHSAA